METYAKPVGPHGIPMESHGVRLIRHGVPYLVSRKLPCGLNGGPWAHGGGLVIVAHGVPWG